MQIFFEGLKMFMLCEHEADETCCLQRNFDEINKKQEKWRKLNEIVSLKFSYCKESNEKFIYEDHLIKPSSIFISSHPLNPNPIFFCKKFSPKEFSNKIKMMKIPSRHVRIQVFHSFLVLVFLNWWIQKNWARGRVFFYVKDLTSRHLSIHFLEALLLEKISLWF